MKIKTNAILILSLCVLLLLSACGGVPAGTLQGKLLAEAGQPVANNELQLLLVTGQQGEELTLETSAYKARTDEQGAFLFEGVEGGKYVIMDLNISFALGGNPPSFAEMVLRAEDGTVLIVELPESKGLDLGDVKAPATAR